MRIAKVAKIAKVAGIAIIAKVAKIPINVIILDTPKKKTALCCCFVSEKLLFLTKTLYICTITLNNN